MTAPPLSDSLCISYHIPQTTLSQYGIDLSVSDPLGYYHRKQKREKL